MVDNNTLAFACTDADKNIVLFLYQPESRDSNGGQKLVRKADFHLGQHVNHMFRIRAKITDPSAGGRLLTGTYSTLYIRLKTLRRCLKTTSLKNFCWRF